jgi:hypothetical protein
MFRGHVSLTVYAASWSSSSRAECWPTEVPERISSVEVISRRSAVASTLEVTAAACLTMGRSQLEVHHFAPQVVWPDDRFFKAAIEG